MKLVPLTKTTILLATFAVLEHPLLAQNAPTTRVSVSSSGVQGNNDSGSYGVAISPDGRFVAFRSYSDDLVAGDTNLTADIFVHDRQTGQTTRVSVDSNGKEANQISLLPSLSFDGRYVAFESLASNLVADDTNGRDDVFVHDRVSGQTVRASLDSNGVEGNDQSGYAALSSDGTTVAFSSLATNLVANDGNDSVDIFVRDLVHGSTERISVDSNGVESNSHSYGAAISSDGRLVAFHSGATNLVTGDTNATYDVFLRDRVAGTTTRISVDSNGNQGDGLSENASMSADGRFIAFESFATNLVIGDTNGTWDVFVHDRSTGQTTRASLDSNSLQANGGSYAPSISADGRFVAFYSYAYLLVPGDSNGLGDLFLRDRTLGATTRIDVSSSGVETNGDSGLPLLSADGRFAAFASFATNLVAGDTNANQDVFVHDNAPTCSAPTNYCTAKVNSLGCTPSIAMSSSPSASSGSGCTLSATQVLGAKNGLFFHGTLGAKGVPFHGGFLCIAPPIQRHAVHNSGGTPGTCTGMFSEDLDALIASGADPVLVAGTTIFVQNWSRDPNAAFGDSLSDAVSATICP